MSQDQDGKKGEFFSRIFGGGKPEQTAAPNTSSASMPITLDEARRAGRRKGRRTAMMVIGAGMTWGGVVSRW